MVFDPAFLSNLVLLSSALAAAFLVALWISLVFWTVRDIRSRTRDPLIHILAALVVTVLFLPGILVYLILRPQRTIEEEYQRSVEEEALLQTIEDVPLCPACGRHVKEDWIACPSCHGKLKKPCPRCGKQLELSWDICPYCSTSLAAIRTHEGALQE